VNHWAASYVGLPWVNGGQGPQAFDCWGLVRHVERQHFGIELPIISVEAADLRAVMAAFDGHAERAHWRLVDFPRDGDAVLLGRGRKKHAVHCGVVVAGSVLHALQGAGVICQSIREIRRQWGRFEFYRYCA